VPNVPKIKSKHAEDQEENNEVPKANFLIYCARIYQQKYILVLECKLKSQCFKFAST